MRVFNTMPKLPANAAATTPDKASDSRERGLSNTLPPGMDADAPAQKAGFIRSRGRALGQRLQNMFKSARPAASPSSAKQDIGTLLRQSLAINHAKFSRHEAGIQQALHKWQGNEASLHALLAPYIVAGKQAPGVPARDGLRSGVTGLLNGIEKEDSGASDGLRNAARQLRETVIFKASSKNGPLESYTLLNFATPGDLGIGKIDELNIPATQKKEIAERMALALGELRDLGEAYIAQAGHAPPRRLHPERYVHVPSRRADDSANVRRAAAQGATPEGRPGAARGTRPVGPRAPRPRPQENMRPSAATRPAVQAAATPAGGIHQDRLIADAGTYLTARELQDVFDGRRTLLEMANTIAERAGRHARNREAGPAAQPAASASPSSSADRDSLELLNNAHKYLSPEELQGIMRGNRDLQDYVHIIQHRVEDGAIQGEYLPAYEEPKPPPLPASHPRPPRSTA